MASSCAAMSSAAATSDSRCSSFCAATRRPRSSSSVSGHSASPTATGSYEFKGKDYDEMTMCTLKHRPAPLVQLQHLKTPRLAQRLALVESCQFVLCKD